MQLLTGIPGKNSRDACMRRSKPEGIGSFAASAPLYHPEQKPEVAFLSARHQQALQFCWLEQEKRVLFWMRPQVPTVAWQKKLHLRLR